MTDKEMTAIYKKWKHRLGLDDWQKTLFGKSFDFSKAKRWSK